MSRPVTVAVIPARYGSTRFPGKVLAPLLGKPMIQYVYERAAAARSIDRVLVATDHEAVLEAVRKFSGEAVMTPSELPSGTDRICTALKGVDADLVINVQGDEPLLPSHVIDDLARLMIEKPEFGMGTVAVAGSRAELADPNKVKVVMAAAGKALYFSRALIPFLRTGGTDMPVYLHWGIYAYRRNVLERFVKLAPGKLENCEKLEQLRALENGIDIQVLIASETTVGVDTPEDLAEAEARLRAAANGGKK